MTIKTDLTRRSFIKSAAAGAGAVAVPMAVTGCGGDSSSSNSPETVADSKLVVGFGHGVASGDPLSDKVIIWTRVTPSADDIKANRSVPVEWKVATDKEMTKVVSSGSVVTTSDVDYTVKVDVDRLLANTTYFYQFFGPVGTNTEVGETKTLPTGFVEKIQLAVCSCANFPAGYFNVYDAIGKSDADVVLHLGDYIYEYEVGQYPTTANVIDQKRNHSPSKETWTLADYRTRYQQYRADTLLKGAHAKKPFICVWDDHELANDSYKDGAENHTEGTEGTFADRRTAAFKAYHEWLPIRSSNDLSDIYRQFEIGDLVNLQMMDTRHVARTKPIDLQADFPEALTGDTAAFAAEIGSDKRTLLGTKQFAAVKNNMRDSAATWQVFGQQVLMGRILVPSELLLSLGQLQGAITQNAPAETVAALQAGIKLKLTELATIKAGWTPSAPGVTPATDADKARIATVAPYNLDAWDGYAYEREVLLNQAVIGNKNLVVLAGDTHNAWASELRLLNTARTAASSVRAGVEFATSSVTSPGFDEYLTFNDANPAAAFEGAVTSLVDDLKFIDASRRGFMLVTFTPEEASSEWNFVSTIASTENVEISKVTYKVKAGGSKTADKLIKVV